VPVCNAKQGHQKIAILKALFEESNRDQPDDFLDLGLRGYDQAAKMAKLLLQDESGAPYSRSWIHSRIPLAWSRNGEI